MMSELYISESESNESITEDNNVIEPTTSSPIEITTNIVSNISEDNDVIEPTTSSPIEITTNIVSNITEDNNVIVPTISSPIEIITNIVSNVTEQTFIDLVKKSLENEYMTNNVSIPLTPEVISIINSIITLKPNILTDIEKAIIGTIKDGKIDSKDIPNLIIVMQSIYKFIYSLKNVKVDTNKRASVTGELLKYFLHVLVIEKKIKIDKEKQSEFLIQIDALISLLSYSKSLKPKGCFKKIFG